MGQRGGRRKMGRARVGFLVGLALLGPGGHAFVPAPLLWLRQRQQGRISGGGGATDVREAPPAAPPADTAIPDPADLQQNPVVIPLLSLIPPLSTPPALPTAPSAPQAGGPESDAKGGTEESKGSTFEVEFTADGGERGGRRSQSRHPDGDFPRAKVGDEAEDSSQDDDERDDDTDAPVINRWMRRVDFSAGAFLISSRPYVRQHRGDGLVDGSGDNKGGGGLNVWGAASRVVMWAAPGFDWVAFADKALSSVASKLDKEVLFGCLAIFGRELFMREVAEQIEALPPEMQPKASKLVNHTLVNFQDKVGVVLASGISWESVLKLVQTEMRSFREEGVDPLTESVAKELLILAASKMFPDLPLTEWNRHVESLSDRTRQFLLRSQLTIGKLQPASPITLPTTSDILALYSPNVTTTTTTTKNTTTLTVKNANGTTAVPSTLLLTTPYASNSGAAVAEGIRSWLKAWDWEKVLGEGGVDVEKLRELSDGIERMKLQSEDLILQIDDEIRALAKGGTPEASVRNVAKSVRKYAEDYSAMWKAPIIKQAQTNGTLTQQSHVTTVSAPSASSTRRVWGGIWSQGKEGKGEDREVTESMRQ